MITYLNNSFYPKGCHTVGTDALVCPHRGAACYVRWNVGADRRERLSLLKKPHPPPTLRMERRVDSIVSHRTNNLSTRQLANSSTRSNHNFEL